MTKLTIKQQRFADEYIISGNATEAAIKAGYSKKTAAVIGNENLIKPYIKKYIDERLKEIEASKFLTMEEALQITASIIRGEPRTLKYVDRDTGETVERLMYPTFKDSNSSLEHFYKINSAFNDKLDININEKEKTISNIESLLKQMKPISEEEVSE